MTKWWKGRTNSFALESLFIFFLLLENFHFIALDTLMILMSCVCFIFSNKNLTTNWNHESNWLFGNKKKPIRAINFIGLYTVKNQWMYDNVIGHWKIHFFSVFLLRNKRFTSTITHTHTIFSHSKNDVNDRLTFFSLCFYFYFFLTLCV